MPARFSFTYRCPKCGDRRSFVPATPDAPVACGRQRQDQPTCTAPMVQLEMPR